MLSRAQVRLLPDEEGVTSVGVLLAVGLTLIVALVMVNLFLYLYGHGVARAAIDEAVRAGSRVGATDVCEERAWEVRDNLMPGPLGEGVLFTCANVGDELVATAHVTLHSPLPGLPAWSTVMEARAVQETGE